MKVYEFKNYDEYVASQKDANEEKQHMHFVKPKTIKKIFDVYGPNANRVLCHGTRRGQEQKYFKRIYPNAEIIGSEIGISDWPMTVQHDFNKIKKEWINKFDIVYSNSIDHAFDIEKTLKVWSNQLNKNGKMFIEKSVDLNCRAWDPVEISDNEIKELFIKLNLKMINKFNSAGNPGQQKTIVYGVIK